MERGGDIEMPDASSSPSLRKRGKGRGKAEPRVICTEFDFGGDASKVMERATDGGQGKTTK